MLKVRMCEFARDEFGAGTMIPLRRRAAIAASFLVSALLAGTAGADVHPKIGELNALIAQNPIEPRIPEIMQTITRTLIII